MGQNRSLIVLWDRLGTSSWISTESTVLFSVGHRDLFLLLDQGIPFDNGSAPDASGTCVRSTDAGLVAAWFVFVLTHFSSFVVSAQLLAFFISSSRWTEYKSKTKDKLTVENKKSGKRNWRQVLCNGGLPTLFAVLFGQSVAFQQPDIALSAT